MERIDLIREWSAAVMPNFDESFLDSLEDWCCNRDMTEAQSDALDNIISKFKIEEWEANGKKQKWNQ